MSVSRSNVGTARERVKGTPDFRGAIRTLEVVKGYASETAQRPMTEA